jgi:two-component system, OmpR family, phosphate regulon sensor histidine kinase PhoR
MPGGMIGPWQHTMWRLLALLAVALLLGVLSGQVWPALALGFAAALVWHYVQLYRLLRLLDSARRIGAPQGRGVFSALGQRLYRRQRGGRERRLRLLNMLRVYRRAAAVLPDATVVLGTPDHRVQWFNEAATRLLGLRHPHDLGKPLADLVGSAAVSAWLADGGHDALLDLPSPLDENLRLSLRMLDYTDDQRLLVARDISKLMRLEQVRRDFVANVSHELRTPLTVVHGYLDLLDDEDLPELATMLREMRNQSRRMTQLVEDLLTLSRLEVQERLSHEHVAMPSLLATLEREAQALSAGQHEIVVEDLAGCDLLGSGKELHSAFSNLVGNAVRYTPAGGRIRIAFEREDAGVRLAVTDSGHGIPAQHIPRLTERFYRVSTSRSRETGGTGLGLSIAKHVLNLHQARLSIESEVGRGSTFACHFGAHHVIARDPAGRDFA